jgi:serine/threonine-protein kinase
VVTDFIERLRAGLAPRYQIERQVGRGGMAQVFLAHEQHPRRQVAIKVLDPEIGRVIGPERFLREVDLASKLTHPNILPVFSAGEVDGILYYTMPFVTGESVRERLARDRRLSVEEGVRIAREVADALAYAHASGVVHRDIKPENLLLQAGHAVVADFGIARAISVAAGDGLTQTGMAVGTPAYMSPEQAAGETTVDGRSDIYSLGCVVYEMLTGEPPFTGPSAVSVVKQHLASQPRALTERQPAVPEALAQAVGRALAKEPADRFATAAEFADALLPSGGTAGGTIAARAPRRFNRRSLLAAIPIVGLVLIALLFRPRAGLSVDPNAVAVFPFRIAGANQEFGYLREGMVDLLAAKLTGEGGPRGVDPRTVISAWRRAGGSDNADPPEQSLLDAASTIGAGHSLLGSIIATPNRLTVQATLISVRGTVGRASAEVAGSPDSLHVLVDQLAGRLLAQQSGAGERLAALTSASLPALRTYLAGQAVYRRGQYAQAEQHFLRALELDSTFALAGLGLVAARYWTEGWFDEMGMAAAWAYRDRLSPRDTALLSGITGSGYPEALLSVRSQIDGLERAVELGPDRTEGWYWLAEVLYHTGAASAVADPHPRAARAFARAADLDPAFAGPLEHLVDLAASSGDTAGVRQYARRYLTIEPSGDLSDYTRWRAALALADSAALRALRLRFDSLSTASLRGILGTALLEGLALVDAERAVAVLRDRAETRPARLVNLQRVHEALLNMGRPREAVRVVELIREVEDEPGYASAVQILGALFGGGDTTAAARAARQLEPSVLAALRNSRAKPPGTALCAVMLWRVTHGQTESARAAIDRLGATARPTTRRELVKAQNAQACELTLEAMLATQEGGATRSSTLARLDSVSSSGPDGSQEVLNIMNLTGARLFEYQGDPARALELIGRFFHYRGTYLTTRLMIEGRLSERLGDRDRAARAYRHYLALRENPAPALAPEVDRVKAALARATGVAR